MYYFKFEIPCNEDGTRVSYSPGWYGTLDKCPKNVVVDLYNDKEGYGIAHCEDTFTPKEVLVQTKTQATSILSKAKDEDGVYLGDKLAHRWDVKEVIDEPVIDEVLDGR